MRGWHVIAVLLVLSVVVTATHNSNNTNSSSNSSSNVPCTDTDGGGDSKSDKSALENKGEVKYGLSEQTDTCLTSDDGVSTSEGKHLKEYFCRDNQRDSDVYNCLALGYSKCSDGECVGATSTTSNQTQQQPEQACGNHQVEKDKGEECDPPFKICFGKTSSQYGQCDINCKCRIAGSAPTPSPLCGDGTKDSNEECETDKDCPTNYLCSSCKCVKQLTQAEIEAMKQQASTGQTEVTKTISDEIDEQYKSPELPEVNLTAKNFSEEPGVKAASGIANFFKKIFGWVAALFS